MKKAITCAFLALMLLNVTSAVVVNSVDVETLAPGEQGQIEIEIENIFDDDVTDVIISLNFQNLPFTPIGSSSQSIDEIEEDDEERFIFTIRSSNEVTAGDFEIPYILSYERDDETQTQTGTIGVRVVANPELSFSVDVENPILNQQGTIDLNIVNKGLFDARFVSVQIVPQGFRLVSIGEEYIGEIESDDFETASFDAIFTDRNPTLIAVVQYRNFDNQLVIQNAEVPFRVYTQEEARELGLVQASAWPVYVFLIILLIIIIVVWRLIRRRRRARRNQRRE